MTVLGMDVTAVRLDPQRISARCRKFDEAFEGFVRISPERRVGDRVRVRIECLGKMREG